MMEVCVGLCGEFFPYSNACNMADSESAIVC